MKIFKKIGGVISTFFKTHTILAMVLVVAIVMVGVWTPVAVHLLKDTQGTQSENSSEPLYSQTSGSSVFIANSSKEESSGNVVTSQNNASVNSSNSSKNDSSKNSTPSDSSSKTENSSSSVSSNNSSDSSVSSNSTSSDTVSKVKPVKDAKKIICWGDSVTADLYPTFLNNLLGNKYNVLNGGSRGEQSQTIAARQGALKVTTTQEFVFKKGVATIDIGTDRNHGMCVEDGTPLDLAMDGNAFTNDVPVNPVYIDGKEYTISIRGAGSSVYDGIFQLTRKDTSKAVTIPKGAEVVFSSAIEQAKGTYCEVFFIGFNDGLATPEGAQKVVERLKAMVKRHRNDNYIVIVNYHASIFREPIINAFGDKALDFGAVITEVGCYEVGVQPTADDIKTINQGGVPACLRLNNIANEIHLNTNGQEYLAKAVYQKGKTLGYWD